MTILLISPYYAPFFHPRAHRWSAIAAYWAATGHRVLVVTSRARGCAERETIDGVEVHRVGFDSLKSLLAARFAALPERGRVGERVDWSGGRWRAAEWIYNNIWKKVCFPDDALFWRKPAVRTARRLIGAERVDVLVSVSLPITAHRVAMALRRSGIPWLADVGDPYAAPGWEISNRYLYGVRARRLEARLMQNADGVVVTNAFLKKWMEETCRIKNVSVIPPLLHPFPEIHAVETRKECVGALQFGYFGSFYPPIREPYAMVSALLRLRSHLPGFTLHLYGDLLPRYLPFLHQYDWIKLYGLRTRLEADQAMKKMDVLWNAGNGNPHLLPSKAVNYLAAGKPIVHVQPLECDAFLAFLNQRASVFHFQNGDSAELSALKDWLLEPQKPKPLIDLHAYGVKAIAEGYLTLFKKM